MDEKNKYKIIVSTLLLVLITIVLLSPFDVLIHRGVVADITSSYTSSDKIWVKTRMVLGSNEMIEELPMNINIWEGYRVVIKQSVIERLNPDMIMERTYYHPNVRRPIWLLIIRAHNTSAFHNPKNCYRCNGWNMVSEQQSEITLNSSIWTAGSSDKRSNDITVSIKELLIEKNGKQRLIKYFYLKEISFASSPGSITIVRAEMDVDNINDTSQYIDNFYSEVLPYLFMPVEEVEDSLAVAIYKKYGLVGALVEVLVVIIMLGYIGYLIKKDLCESKKSYL